MPGYCNRQDCPDDHQMTTCSHYPCHKRGCDQRHPKKCRWWETRGHCNWGEDCCYRHLDITPPGDQTQVLIQKIMDDFQELKKQMSAIMKKVETKFSCDLCPGSTFQSQGGLTQHGQRKHGHPTAKPKKEKKTDRSTDIPKHVEKSVNISKKKTVKSVSPNENLMVEEKQPHLGISPKESDYNTLDEIVLIEMEPTRNLILALNEKILPYEFQEEHNDRSSPVLKQPDTQDTQRAEITTKITNCENCNFVDQQNFDDKKSLNKPQPYKKKCILCGKLKKQKYGDTFYRGFVCNGKSCQEMTIMF